MVRTELQWFQHENEHWLFHRGSTCCLCHAIGLCLECWIFGPIVMVGILIFTSHRRAPITSSKKTLLCLYSGLVVDSRDSILNGSLKWSILIKCDFHGPNWLIDVGIDNFIIVIRLSKVEQSAFFRVSHVPSFGYNSWPLWLASPVFATFVASTFFSGLSKQHCDMQRWRQQACPLTCRCSPFGFLVR